MSHQSAGGLLGAAHVHARIGSWGLLIRLRTVAVSAVLVILISAVAVLAMLTGDYPVTLAEIRGAFAGDPNVGFASTVILEWRLPRIAAGIVFGAALSLGGAIFQSLTRNPLASPDIIGFSTGSYSGALIVLIAVGGGFLGAAVGAVAGGLLSALLVYVLAYSRGVQGFALIVNGIALSAMLTALNTWLLLISREETAVAATAWGIGSLNGIAPVPVLGAGAVIGVLCLLSAWFAPAMRQLELGDDTAAATGVRIETVRVSLIAIGVACTAVVTAAAGPIAFVALAAPQIARRLARSHGMALLPSTLVGALMLSAADFTAQHLLPAELPVGVVTVIIGGIYLVWLLIREARTRSLP